MSGHLSQEQADEYAVGSLDPELERIVALHIAECSPCREAVEDAQRVAGLLAFSAPLHPAPGRLRARVVTRAGIRRPLWIRVLSIGQAAAGIAAVFVAIAAFTGMVSMKSQVSELRQKNADLSTRIQDVSSQEVEIFALSRRLTDAEQKATQIEASAEKDRELLAAMLNPESDVAEVVALEGAGGSVGRLVWEADQERLWFYARKLPVLASNQTYQVWVEAGGQYTSLGTFLPDANGTARYERLVPGGIANYASVIVTVETLGGSPAREGTGIFYVADLPRP